MPAFPSCVPVLTDGVVTLRAHRRSDVDAIVEASNDPEMVRWTTVPRPYRKADALRWLKVIREGWENGGTQHWAIEWTPDGEDSPRYAGTVDLRPRAGRVAEIGFGLHPDARGEGLMSRAVRLACSHAFDEGLGEGPVERVHWSAVVGNFASWRVAWATGFVHHGTIPRMGGPAYPTEDGRLEARDHWVASLAPRAPMVPQTPWLEVPVLEGEGIRLRPWREDDGDYSEPLAGPSHHMPSGAAPDDLTFDHWLLVRRERSAHGRGSSGASRTPRPTTRSAPCSSSTTPARSARWEPSSATSSSRRRAAVVRRRWRASSRSTTPSHRAPRVASG